MIEWTGQVKCEVEGIGMFFLSYVPGKDRPWKVVVYEGEILLKLYRPSLSDAIGFVELCKQMGRLPENR